jgi:hypothetical protein
MKYYRNFKILIGAFLWCAVAQASTSDLVHQVSAVIVGPVGEVVLFTRSGSDITIKTCVDHSIIQGADDCDLAPGTQPIQIKSDILKESFRRIIVAMPFTGDRAGEYENRICIYGKNYQRDIDSLRAQIKVTQDFLQFYCKVESESDPCISSDDQSTVKALGEKLARLIYSKYELKTADQFVDRLLDQVIGGKGRQVFRASDLEDNFFYQVLKNYTLGKIPRVLSNGCLDVVK